ncbi:SICAvar, type I (fragment) [Plasmodium knowlesi strain H]|uniref:SICAvar, type I n=2 Tax=Plasmodium knowlesi (strain H) TaxID=5851 RepID=A0A679L851_PLAKH
MVDGVGGPASADACSGGQSDAERKASEDTRTKLKDAWDDKLKELREKWQKEQSLNALSQGGSGTPVPVGFIPPDVKSKADEMLEDLGTYLDLLNHSQTAADACAELTGRYKGETSDVKKVCTVLVKVVNWMGGLTANGVEKKNKISEQNWVQYLRCVIGYEVILRTLTKKCKAQRMLKIISDTMEKGGSKPTGPNVSSICPWVKLEDIGDNEGSIGNEVQKWLNKAKGGSSGGGIRGFDNIVAWYRCTEKEEEEEKAKQKAQTCQSDRIMDLMKGGMSHQLNVLVDPIAAANDCIEKAENNGKDRALCNRLKCIEEYLQETTTTPATTAAATEQSGKRETEHIEDDDDGKKFGGAVGGSGTGSGGGAGGTKPMWQAWLEKWLQQNGATVTNGVVSGKSITEKLWEDLKSTYDAFVEEVGTQESFEISKLCETTGKFAPQGGYESGVKTLCQAILKIRYFMSGVKTKRRGQTHDKRLIDHPVRIEGNMPPGETFKRCIVGMVGLWDIYQDHCKLGDVIQKVQADVDKKLVDHLKGQYRANLNMCRSITPEGLTIGRTVLGDRIKQWARHDRGEAEEHNTVGKLVGRQSRANRWVGGALYLGEAMCPKEEDARREAREDNMKVMAQFISLPSTTQDGGNSSKHSVLDVLMNDNIRIPDSTLENVLPGIMDTTTGKVDLDKLNKAIEKIEKDAGTALKGGQCKDIEGLCGRAQCAGNQWFKDRGKDGTVDKEKNYRKINIGCIRRKFSKEGM